ncbi:inactive pancreatic lipase-related protein 1 [Drosophila montana]|uniref:inactive pancreatic lipase-related protein 1 n=1 Tax=Drosophila montana TaxID=40370 RepID=UPI00313B16B5
MYYKITFIKKYSENNPYLFLTRIIIWTFLIYKVHSKLDQRHNGNIYGLQNETLVNQQRGIRLDVRKTLAIQFYKNNTKTLETYLPLTENKLDKSGCLPSEKFSIVLHGWIQSCSDEWAVALIERLSFYRRGCVICIDYSYVASSSYVRLYANFEYISEVIVSIVISLFQYGFDPSRGYLFGFSFGGQLASAVGRILQPQFTIQNIDTCDMAGPGFDPIDIDHSKAGKIVQCFHTSRDKGTLIYSCHRNIMLGSCGLSQPSVASQLHLGSHGLCVDIYINTFDYPFYALRIPPPECISLTKAANIPNDYTVGYQENFNKQVFGKIFVPTSLHYPYNLSKKELQLISRMND